MTIIKYALSIFGFLIIMSCGQADTSSSDAKAESKTNSTEENQTTESNVNLAQPVSVKTDNQPNTPDNEVEVEVEVENDENEMVSGNIENPTPVKKNQKVEKPPIKPKVKKSVKKEIVDTKKPETITTGVKTETKNLLEVDGKNSGEADMKKKIQKVSEDEPEPEFVKEVIPAFSHETFNNLLNKHVSSSGKVNYNNFKKDETKLDAYLKLLDENPPASNWSKSKKMAYWINAYNAATIKLILKNYPVKSIMNLHGGKPWDQKWIPLGGKTYSLNNIENDILRPTYKDARIHFAVNCAAKSCPPLLNKAWTESNLNSTLEKQTKSFINDVSQNTISADAVEISKIFDWYAKDFGDIISYLNKYSTVKINAGAKVTYKEYNWDLNK